VSVFKLERGVTEPASGAARSPRGDRYDEPTEPSMSGRLAIQH
jgi:hypothetical protein